MSDFKVLWFEDNLQDFDKVISKLESHCGRQDRLFLFDHYDHYPDDFDVMLFDGRFSLAFIDLNLNNGQKGIQIVEILRSRGAYIDILLYSNNPLELIQLTEGDNYVEGIFRHATLEEIGEKMQEVIDQVIYKENMCLTRFGH